MSTDRRSRAWVEIDAAALRRNVGRIASAAGGTGRLLPVVKADAYGLGLDSVLAELETTRPWGYGVAEVREAEAVREFGATRRVLILNALPPGDVEAAVAGGFEMAVSSVEEVDRIADAAAGMDGSARVHVEVDTGMGRAGLDWRQARRWGGELLERTSDRVRWTGLFTHFHSAGEGESDRGGPSGEAAGSAVEGSAEREGAPTPPAQGAGSSVRFQARRFEEARSILVELGGGGWVEHLCNSAAVLRVPELTRDFVRPGIFLYGGIAAPDLPAPETVVSLRARVVRIREVVDGTTVGYGATYRASGRERWATVAIGYGDGLPRSLGNRGEAIVGGRRVPIIGRISMGLTVVDITGLSDGAVRVGDVVTYLGRDGEGEITVDEVAGLAGTISYEILTGLSSRLPRVWSESSSANGTAPTDGIHP